MAYADFAFYTGTYKGNEIPAADFPRLAERASEEIDAATFLRARDASGAELDAVKKAMCAVAEVLLNSSVFGVVSERVGGHSVTYSENSQRENVRMVIRKYLSGTGLLYRGLC